MADTFIHWRKKLGKEPDSLAGEALYLQAISAFEQKRTYEMVKKRRPIGVATINLQSRMLVAIFIICLGIVLNM